MRIGRKVYPLLTLAAMALGACGTPAVTSSASSGATSLRTPSATASATPIPATATPTQAPPAPEDLDFNVSFMGRREGQAMANALTTSGGELIAVGVEYEHPLPLFGPLPAHEGRVWSSPDGRTWQDVTPPGTFENVVLHTLIVRADGSLVAFGSTASVNQYGELATSGFGAWESTDRRTWTPTRAGLPADRWVRDAVQGQVGILADLWEVGDTHATEVWFSQDGESWEMVRRLIDVQFGMDAGDEGFVVAGTRYSDGLPPAPFAIASADGREWFSAASPPNDVVDVAAIGGDWLALSVPPDLESMSPSFAAWESANGLDWSRTEDIQLYPSTFNDAGCRLHPSLESAGRYVIARSVWVDLCSEGRHVSHGPHELALDGRGWQELVLEPAGSPGFGTGVTAAVFDGRLVLVGESNGRAAFWIGE